MKLKRILAGALAAAVTIFSVALSSFSTISAADEIAGTLTITAANVSNITETVDVAITGEGEYTAKVSDSNGYFESNYFKDLGFFTYTGTGDFTIDVTSIKMTDKLDGTEYVFTDVPHSTGLVPASEYTAPVSGSAENAAALPRQYQYDADTVIAGDSSLCIKSLDYLTTTKQAIGVAGTKAILDGNAAYVDTIEYTFTVTAVSTSSTPTLDGTLTITAANYSGITETVDVAITGEGEYTAKVSDSNGYFESNYFKDLGFFTYTGTGDFTIDVTSIKMTDKLDGTEYVFTDVPHSTGLVPASEYTAPVSGSAENAAALPRQYQYDADTVIAGDSSLCIKSLDYLTTTKQAIGVAGTKAILDGKAAYVNTIEYTFTVTASTVVADPVDTTALEEALAAADAIDTSIYTSSSVAALTAAVTAGNDALANADATQTEIDEAAAAITAAIEALVNATELEAAVATAEALDTTGCTADSAAALASAIDSANTVLANADATQADVDAATAAINTAIAGLSGVVFVTTEDLKDTVSTAATDATVILVTAGQGDPVLNYIYYGGQTYNVASGTAGSDMVGATAVKVYFDCASDVSYNPWASIDITATVAGSQTYNQFMGTDSSYSGGTTGWSETLTLSKTIAEGNSYSVDVDTWAWGNANDYVYAVTKVEFLDSTGTVLATIESNVADDVSALKAAIVEAYSVDTTPYTAGSVAAMNDALLTAVTVIGTEDASQSDVDTAATALTAAIAALALPADKTELEDAIATAQALDTTNYTDDSVSTLTDAIAAGNEVLANADAIQSEADEATAAIKAAVDALTLKSADYTAVESALENVPADLSIYTDDTVAALNDAINAVDYTKKITEQADVDAMADAINAAIAALVEIPVDTTYLETAIADAEDVDTSLYTAESVANLTAALENAQTVLANADSTQDEVDAATARLNSAIAALEEVATTYSVAGTIYVSDEDTTTDMTVVAEAADGTETSVTATSMGEYVIEGLEAGTYTITISGGKYAPRSYEVEVSESLSQDVYLNPYGDVNGDGKVTTADVGLANSHAKGVTTLEDYAFICADVNLDGSVTTADVGKINSHAKGVVALW
ncbi:MAG: FIVAR domain-containing protein [Ruminococcus sp.]|nr:FIVAR domain-containing protein [Ruminococcus sp.]